MRKLTTIFFFILSLNGFSQSIDEIVYKISDSVSSHKTDSLAKSLDSMKVIDITKSETFNIDTIVVANGTFPIFSISASLLTTNGTTISRAWFVGFYAVNQIAGNYYISGKLVVNNMISGVSVIPQLINGNKLCIVKVTNINHYQLQIHYRRSEQ